MGKKSFAALLLVVVLPACGAPGRGSDTAGSPRQGLFETTATVLSSPEHDAMLCLGGIADSFPPQCGDVPITNWDWERVEGEERAAGTAWGLYHMTGTFDGDAFTVTDVGLPDDTDPPTDNDEIGTPCNQPDGGWPVPDPDRAADDDVSAANAAISHDPEFAGLWIEYPLPATATDIRSLTLLNVAFTADLANHEEELRKHWGGPLCIVQFERSLRELEGIQSELSGPIGEKLDLQVLSSGIDVTDNSVDVSVVVLDAAARDALSERYGPGTVRAVAALLPAS